MTQPTIDEALERFGAAMRTLFPPMTEEEQARSLAESQARIADDFRAHLTAHGTVACALCLNQRPRTRDDEPFIYPAEECEKAGETWHHERDWTRQTPGTEK